MSDDINRKLDIVKKILTNLAKRHSDIVSFLFIHNRIDEDKGGVSRYDQSYAHEGIPSQFQRVIDVANTDYITQRSYKYEAENNTALIVYCLDNTNLPDGYLPIQMHKFYKVLSINKLKDGLVTYDLEGLLAQDMKIYNGYNSKRFSKITSSILNN